MGRIRPASGGGLFIWLPGLPRSWHRRGILFVTGILLAWLPQIASGAYLVGIEFVKAPTFSPFLGSGIPSDGPSIYPYEYANSPFASNGALDGVTLDELEIAVVDAVQDMFRLADIGLPGRMLHIHIVRGPVGQAAGTSHVVGASNIVPAPTVYGIAEYDAANTRPDLDPAINYYYPTNQLSISLADSIAALPVTYTSFTQIVNALAGTAAHEIAHTLGVLNHDPGTPVDGVYSVMASGATGLPASARLEVRRFLNIPNTQPGNLSVTDVLLQNASTTATTDFNFDGVTNVADRAIYLANVGQSGVTVTRGDATGDHVVDIRDRAAYLQSVAQHSSLFAFTATASVGMPLVQYDPVTGLLAIEVDDWTDVNAIQFAVDELLSVVSDPDGAFGSEWITYHVAGRQNWESLDFNRGGSLVPGLWDLALLPAGLDSSYFAGVTIVASDGSMMDVPIAIVPEPTGQLIALAAGSMLALSARRRTAN